nr:hypothetical protein BaRGS_013595 [Batillaria attramentaria]
MNYYLNFVGDLETSCLLVLEGLDCIEEVLCRCEYGSDHQEQERGFRALMVWYHYFNTLSQCGNDTWADNVGSSIIGAIEVNGGVNCSVHNPTAGAVSLELAISEVEEVSNVTRLCAPMNVCYQAFDTDLSQALIQHDWPEFCSVNNELLTCLLNASCECGVDTNQDVVALVELERQLYADSCSLITGSSLVEYGITCPGIDVCTTDEPHFGCLSEYEVEANGATSIPEFCSSLYQLVDCTENLACDCGFYQEPYYYRSLAIAKYNYVDLYSCEELTGSFPNHTGLSCRNDSHLSEEEKLLVLELADATFVAEEEANCSGIQACYDTANAQGTIAHRNKDLAAICEIEKTLVECLEDAYCECDRLEEVPVYNRLFRMRLAHQTLCFSTEVQVGQRQKCTREVCESAEPHSGCVADFDMRAKAATTTEEFCTNVYQLANCTEELACDCGFYQDPYYYRSLAISKYYYVDTDCESITGPFPNHTGLTCKDDGDLSDAEKILIVELADTAYVAAEEATCPGVQSCYDVANAQTTIAHRNKDLEVICEADKQLVLCLEQAYCACGRLNEEAVYGRLSRLREVHAILCNGVIVLAEGTECRGQSTCALSNPLSQCATEYKYDIQQAATDIRKECEAIRDYIICTEEVACTCGLLEDATDPMVETIYNYTTTDIRYYQNQGCSRLVGGFFGLEGGIDCESGQTGNPDERRLILSYAESDEVASLAEKCSAVYGCFKANDASRRDALVNRNFDQLCRVQQTLVNCLQSAYCYCGLADDPQVRQYLSNEIGAHNELCDGVNQVDDVPSCDTFKCNQVDPLSGCVTEYQQAQSRSGQMTKTQQCQAHKDFVSCMEEIGCSCNILADATNPSVFHIYNSTTFAIKAYEDSGCSALTGAYTALKGGLDCSGEAAQQRLVLNFASSTDVVNRDRDCSGVKKCFQASDEKNREALIDRDYVKSCQVSEALIHCEEKAYCACGKNGTQSVVDYLNSQIAMHNNMCSPSCLPVFVCLSVFVSVCDKFLMYYMEKKQK